MEKPLLTVGKTPVLNEIQSIAFYDSEGRIHHMHHIVMLDGARSLEFDMMIKQAQEQANILGVDVSKLNTIHVLNLENPRAMYRVDVKEKKLVEIEPPKPSFLDSPR